MKKTINCLLLLFLALFLSINKSSTVMAETSMESSVKSCITEMLQIIDQKGKENPKFLMSSNPYAYVKDNRGYNNLVNLGPKALPVIQKLIESGYNEYYLAIAAEDISQVDLKENFYRWDTAEAFAKTFREFLGQVPNKVNQIVNSNKTDSEKNKDISKLGIFSEPYVAEHIKNRKIESSSSLKNLLDIPDDKINELKQLKEILTEPIVNSNISASKKQEDGQISKLNNEGSQVLSLTKPSSYYDKYSWTWHYAGSATTTYNCLAYALGYTDRKIWPWSSNIPTHAEAISYLRERGYDPQDGLAPKIIAYGNSNGIVHFSRYIGSSESRAKWGGLELMTHYSTDPYYEYDPNNSNKADQYGKQQIVFWK
ncbi:hypothetical protein LGL55_18355 [Clostridium tagluense]|uniref:DUF7689 domain-containing protein n=1 Tax=Clostridium tagluense TaxID=360422 RepID=UPI001CF21285|nr:hypothetical protein [Clostridium tagluense]MCB2313262.1 hypothetical protein [Clostridium tagluense]MCB2317987.1 hypothetical protein [Clostridium tagluense]MCB2322817.1 hypothetical protein [Clostridium tagluense]MCB2327771.1 hypothetical protein [Clostridium tagluense]MCB2332418.1 hypothetical protein [Clostridium tagluense]